MTYRLLLVALIVFLAGCAPGRAPKTAADSPPWHLHILATVFWVGEPGNEASAWDPNWVRSFGGVDDPKKRDGFLPAGFRPKRNPFYCALPCSDAACRAAGLETIHGRWVEVRVGDRSCFCQVEDVGPWFTDDRDYVFSGRRPRAETDGRAGIDLSPAVRDFLGLSGKDLVDWRFAEAAAVPAGPWKNWDR
jgi:hypothetical protein